MALTKVKLQELIDGGEIDLGTPATTIGLLDVYPIGAIYLSVGSTSPATLFGGTWAALGGRFLIGVDGTYTAGKEDGAATHTLAIGEIPVHKHMVNVSDNTGKGIAWQAGSHPGQSTINTGNAGSGNAHNNMPPYLAVYMWKRTA